ncbi:hypothetical protein BT69DRAFT_356113 [Atractiella rhizophila]|nr:hypothetical protein BT69DRAFT_356113 [Atractiella rhizophila]
MSTPSSKGRRESLLILESSPALHALKRPQLLALCKKHGLKANGKNVEIIERLKEHGHTLRQQEQGVSPQKDGDEVAPPASPSKSSPAKSILNKNLSPSTTRPKIQRHLAPTHLSPNLH